MGPTLLVATVGKESASFRRQPAPVVSKGFSYMDLALAGSGIISLFGSLGFLVQGFGCLQRQAGASLDSESPPGTTSRKCVVRARAFGDVRFGDLGLLDLQGSSSRGGSDLGCRGLESQG